MKPKDLPAAKDVKIDPALRNVTEWRLENSDEVPTTAKILTFLEDHKESFFKSVGRALKRIDHNRRSSPVA
jgi:hypothetical protein